MDLISEYMGCCSTTSSSSSPARHAAHRLRAPVCASCLLSCVSARVVRLCLSVLSALAPVVPPLLRLRPAGLPLASQVYSLIYRCAVRTHTLAPALRQFSSLVQVP
ncbi:unnamed protein product [Tilletia laevis]|nr:unnamed protein product [Tilletia laevis]